MLQIQIPDFKRKWRWFLQGSFLDIKFEPIFVKISSRPNPYTEEINFHQMFVNIFDVNKKNNSDLFNFINSSMVEPGVSEINMCEFKLVCYDWRDSCIEEWLLKEAYIQSISMSNADDEARAGDQPSEDFDITLNINYKLSIPTTSEKTFSSALNEGLTDCGEPSTENQMNYIVVQVDLDYDYIQDVKYINRFTTESEAENFIQDKREEQHAQYKALNEYIEKYVEAIELPEANIDHNGWKEFMKKYNFHGFLWTPNEFKKEFQFYLKRNHYSVNIPGYYPPIVSNKYNNLFIIDASKTDNL